MVAVAGDPSDPMTWQYPGENYIRYPKAGVPNPTVTVFVHDLENPEGLSTLVVPPPGVVAAPDGYLFSTIGWLNEGKASCMHSAQYVP